jgi:hypothetical protein
VPGAEAMTAFTPEADARLAGYLGQVRAALAAASGVDPAEVEADIREHVDAEFAGRPGSVGLADLDEVLTRLGPPAAWAGGGGDARPIAEQLGAGARAVRDGLRQTARGVADVLWRGPEDWRLAYLTFAAFVVALVAVYQGLSYRGPDPYFRPLVAVLAAYLLARATVTAARVQGVDLGARQWLVYPPLVLVSLPLLVGTLAFPLGAGVTVTRIVAHEVEDSKRWPNHHPAVAPWVRDVFPGLPNVKPIQTGVTVGVGVAALGYTVLGVLAAAFPGAVRAAFAPFLAGTTGRFGRRLALGAFAVLVAWGVAAYPLADRVTAASHPPPAEVVGTIVPAPPTPTTRRVGPSRPPTIAVLPPVILPSGPPEVLPLPRER